MSATSTSLLRRCTIGCRERKRQVLNLPSSHSITGNISEADILHLQERDELLNENETLKTRVTSQQEQIQTLQRHIGVIRQHTISFILEQMDTLNIQRDSEV